MSFPSLLWEKETRSSTTNVDSGKGDVCSESREYDVDLARITRQRREIEEERDGARQIRRHKEDGVVEGVVEMSIRRRPRRSPFDDLPLLGAY